MEEGPLRSSDARLRSFVKAEKWEPDRLAKPRLIFPRSPRYNLVLASWLKPFEHWLWGNLKSRVVSGTGNSRVVAKGLNQAERANLILRKMRNIPNCVVFEVDGKAFEAHVDVWQLAQEHSVYESAYPGDGSLKKTLNRQLHNKGVTSCGVRFSRYGGRASGDYNTGMGNTLVMLAVVMGSMSFLGQRVWDTLVDGDNALLFLPGCDARRVHAEFAAAALLVGGHQMVLERPVCVVEEVCFGRSHPVRLEKGWTMVRDWRRVVSHGVSSHDHLREPSQAKAFLRVVASCEAFLADGVPVLWAFANRLLACTEGWDVRYVQAYRKYEIMGVPFPASFLRRAREPDELARQSFERAFGVNDVQQRNIEQWLGEFSVVPEPAAPGFVDDVYRLRFE